MADPDDFSNFTDEAQTSGLLFHSVSRDSTPSNANSPVITMNNHSAGYFQFNCTADPAAASVVFTLQVAEPGLGTFTDWLELATIAATGDFWVLVGSRVPDASTKTGSVHSPAGGVIDSVWDYPMPRLTRLKAVHADGDDITYSVGFQTVKAGSI